MLKGDPTTKQYSVSGSKYIGDGNAILVATDASEDTNASLASKSTLASGDTNCSVGNPTSIVLISTHQGTAGSSTSAKNMSTDVTYAPSSPTLNDCAKGSLPPLLPLLPLLLLSLLLHLFLLLQRLLLPAIGAAAWTTCLIITGAGGGGGGGVVLLVNVIVTSLCIVVVSNVVTLTSVCITLVVPVAENTAVASDIVVPPLISSKLLLSVVTLTSLSPDLIFASGSGVEYGSLIHIAAVKSPNPSEFNVRFLMVACAPLVCPATTVPTGRKPKKSPCADWASAAVSILITVEPCEYAVGNVSFISKGFAWYVFVGAAKGPFLWSGLQSLKRYVSPLTNAVIVSPTLNAPTTLSTPIILGTTSTFPWSSKNW